MDCELFTSLSQTSHNASNLVSGKWMDGSIGRRVKDAGALSRDCAIGHFDWASTVAAIDRRIVFSGCVQASPVEIPALRFVSGSV